jgi:hypothetical protein
MAPVYGTIERPRRLRLRSCREYIQSSQFRGEPVRGPYSSTSPLPGRTVGLSGPEARVDRRRLGLDRSRKTQQLRAARRLDFRKFVRSVRCGVAQKQPRSVYRPFSSENTGWVLPEAFRTARRGLRLRLVLHPPLRPLPPFPRELRPQIWEYPPWIAQARHPDELKAPVASLRLALS